MVLITEGPVTAAVWASQSTNTLDPSPSLQVDTWCDDLIYSVQACQAGSSSYVILGTNTGIQASLNDALDRYSEKGIAAAPRSSLSTPYMIFPTLVLLYRNLPQYRPPPSKVWDKGCTNLLHKWAFPKDATGSPAGGTSSPAGAAVELYARGVATVPAADGTMLLCFGSSRGDL